MMNAAAIVKKRPLSPPSGTQPNILRPFAKDMCGNPMCYFPKGRMQPLQNQQVMEISLHCAQWTLMKQAMLMRAKRYVGYKKKILKSEANAHKQLRWARQSENRMKYKVQGMDQVLKTVVRLKGEISALKIENARLREKQL